MRPQKPLISVLIDTFNYGQYVEEAIESAIGQDFPVDEREILVVDDGSTDDTAGASPEIRDGDHVFSETEWRAGVGVQFWTAIRGWKICRASGCR